MCRNESQGIIFPQAGAERVEPVKVQKAIKSPVDNLKREWKRFFTKNK